MSKYTIGIDYGSPVRPGSPGALRQRRGCGRKHHGLSPRRHGRRPERRNAPGPGLGAAGPQDYLDVLDTVIPAVLRESGVAAEDVIGVGTDFTACTVLPVKADGTPLCFLPQFRSTPNAYVKLWKHHAAEKIRRPGDGDRRPAGRAVPAALWRQNFQRVGNSKIWQILDESPEVYEAADHIVEGGDWIVWQLTGVLRKNTCAAGYKGTWSASEGYPPRTSSKPWTPACPTMFLKN